MQAIAEQIHIILKDYQSDYDGRKYEITVAHIIEWANQFGDDALFVLTELLHFLPEVYISKEKAKNLLRKRLLEIQKIHGCKTMIDMVIKTHFFDVQKVYKSQSEILLLVDEILQSEFMIDYKEHIDKPKTVFIYFDDVIATGGTVVRDLSEWLETKSDGVNENYKLILNKSKSLVLSTFCYHQLGFGNMEYRLMKKFDDKIKKVLIVKKDYVIENQARWNNQRLNCAFPVSTQSPPVFKYLSNFSELRGNDSVFRNVNKPINETFFTNPTNRNRLETIFINKGLELLNKVKSSDVDFSKRPLGYTVRSHKTLGTGTLFFTWRNVSNTCPLVFWWDVPGHNWLPLFGLKNRGL